MKANKTQIFVLSIFCVLILLMGCGEKEREKSGIITSNAYSDITDITETMEQEEESESSETFEFGDPIFTEEEEEASPLLEPIDPEAENTLVDGEVLDLTLLGSSMVYGEVFSMVNYPEQYLNKQVKVAGAYFPSYYEETDKYYHYVVIADATACCQSGLEFIWLGHEEEYPENYPKDGDTIIFTGIYKKYEELGKTYYYLEVESLEILD